MLTLKVSPKAETDLIGIWAYTFEKWGPDQADRYLDLLEQGMQQLTLHPTLGVDYSHVLRGYRRLQVEHYGVFYKVAAPEILVARVLHDSMDAPPRLQE